MNWWLLIGAGMTAFIEIGHATAGKRMYYVPAVAEIGDPVVRTTVKFIWHLADAAFLVIIVGAVWAAMAGGPAVVAAISYAAAAFFAGLTVIHLSFSLRSGVANPMVTMFQWAFFLVAAFAFLMAALS